MRRISDLSLSAPACRCTCFDCVHHAVARHDAGITQTFRNLVRIQDSA